MGEGIRTDAAKPVDFAKAIARRPGAAQRLVAFSTDAKRMEFVLRLVRLAKRPSMRRRQILSR